MGFKGQEQSRNCSQSRPENTRTVQTIPEEACELRVRALFVCFMHVCLCIHVNLYMSMHKCVSLFGGRKDKNMIIFIRAREMAQQL